MSAWLIYGATGYTGALIARAAAGLGLRPVVAGRSALAVESLGKELGFEARVLRLDDRKALAAGLAGIDLVLNCAGPFSRTAEPMLDACLAARAHYLDITGEIDVFERAHGLDAAAKAAGIVICPGVGFDVIPTDCIALMLKESMPAATHLALGFDGPRTLSPGTAKTLVEHLGAGGKVRRDGRIVSVPYGSDGRSIDFGGGRAFALPIPWGDVATAYHTTGIANVTVYARASRVAALVLRLLSPLRGILRSAAVVRFLTRRIERTIAGPTAEERASAYTHVWGEARDAAGNVQQLRLRTAHPYALTVTGALGVVRRLLDAPAPPGSTTPATLMGSGYVLDLPGTTLDA